MIKVLNQKVAAIVYVCLGFVNLLSFFLLPFYGQIYLIGRIIPTPIHFLFWEGSTMNRILLPAIIFGAYALLSVALIILGLTQLLSKKAHLREIPITSNKNPFFILSLILLTVSLFALPMFYVNASLNNEILEVMIPERGLYEIGGGAYTIFPLNALISLGYILWVTCLANKESKF